MPVLATMAAMALLRGSEDGALAFTDVKVLRSSLHAALTDEDGTVLEDSLSICDRIQALIDAYQGRIEETLDTYIAQSEDQYTFAPERITLLTSMDTEREILLGELIDARQALHQLLTNEQWSAVFPVDQ